MAMKQREKTTVGRREFLRVLGAGAGAAAATAVPLASSAVAAESEQEMKKARYRETEDVKTFYRVNRYPS
jgi:secreted PhoX family phosphatase